jgi:glutamate-ammonia-ligase adenylyltransferase
MAKALIDHLKTATLPFAMAAGAGREVGEFLTEAGEGDDKSAARLADLAEQNPGLFQLIGHVMAHAPFLSSIIARRPAMTLNMLTRDPVKTLDDVNAGLWLVLAEADEAEAMAQLRLAREQVALACGLCDLAGLWPVMEVTARLSRFADAATGAAVSWLFRRAHGRGEFVLSDIDDPQPGCGYVVLGMGKLGAGELNYSSDIDLIVLYDPETAPVAEGTEPARFFVRLTQALVKLLQEPTGDGYVFRVDLRLRPDPGATAVAISLEAAGQYYENLGQNWERAAMIKARAIAGDKSVAEAFLARLSPFIWRKNLDFAAINDIHSMKRQIHAHKGHGSIAVSGHNIKLGRGGIREIEFFAQTQQLIAGGRLPELRTRTTLDTLRALAEHGWITVQARDEMSEAYEFLRRIEHLIQMRFDEQSHTLPREPHELARFAAFAGFETLDLFVHAMTDCLERVQGHYAALFEDAPELAGEGGSLVFTGGEDDPDTIATLTQMGFKTPQLVSEAVRGWHFGRYPATRATRSREILTELMPTLLGALAATANPDLAFLGFDKFLSRLPAGVQLFSLLRANPKLLDLLAAIMGTAPRLAASLSEQVSVLDAVLDPNFDTDDLARTELDSQVNARVAQASDFEAGLDEARIIAHEHSFRIGVHLLSGTADTLAAGARYADLAASLIAGLLDLVEGEMAHAHGRIAGGRCVVVGMGKLGGEEMAATSDLDLMLIYDYDEEAEQSDGARPLDPVRYYNRLTQRLISALSVPTAEGQLYEVDMRLRPSGRSGPIATRLKTFDEYQKTSAWTWEHMALTRARVVAGSVDLAPAVDGIVARTLKTERDRAKLAADVDDMRQKIEAEKRTDDPWDLKQVRGGLVDMEFLCQFLQLVHAGDGKDVLRRNTGEGFAALAEAGVLPADQATPLIAAYRYMSALSQIVRLCLEERIEVEALPEGLAATLARSVDAPTLAIASDRLLEHQALVRSLYREIITAAIPGGS